MLLEAHHIGLVVDVRSVPYSRHAPQFNLTSVQCNLSRFGLEYEYLGNMIGGKFTDSEFLDENGCIDFNKAVKSESFQKGLDAVISKINSGSTLVLMCSEKDPVYCHRFLLISRELSSRGIRLIHLLADGSEVDNSVLVNNIAYGKNQSGFMQMNLFSNNENVHEDMVYQSLMLKKKKMKR